MNGGYVMLDFKGITLTSSETTHYDCYNIVDYAYKSNKPILVNNVLIDNEYFGSSYVTITRKGDTSYMLTNFWNNDYKFSLEIYSDGDVECNEI